ncbi:hypothetical protein [Bacillus sp. FJAT-29814]|uniref:hypothetical protein n=1 Tax=Bacillus sp. FJAT-29814 TaxID=1729688 RepID=UPI0008295480|nr:hypothetical protein [Bacillus sp. FJAT-29814]
MNHKDIEKFLTNQGLTFEKILNERVYNFKRVKIPEHKLNLINSYCLKEGWYLVEAGRDIDDPYYIYMNIRPAEEFKVKVIISSDGSSYWYRKDSIFKAKFSDKMKDTYEVIEPTYSKGKSIHKSHSEIIELL